MEKIVEEGIENLHEVTRSLNFCFFNYDYYFEVASGIETLYNIVRIGYGLQPVDDIWNEGLHELLEVRKLHEQWEYEDECYQQEQRDKYERENECISSGHNLRSVRNLASELGFDDDLSGLDEDDLWEQTGH